jgi:hypothetical protein
MMRLSDAVCAGEFRGVTPIAERRGSNRFPMAATVRYRSMNDRTVTMGSGTTLNMGSGGVLFTTEDRLPVGGKVEVAVNWPVMLDGGCRLKFVARGRVLRSDEHSAAVRIDRYEFHTRASHCN